MTTLPIASTPAIATLTVRPSVAADAYGRVERGDSASGPGDFSAVMQRAMQAVTDAGHSADAKSIEAISGGGDLTEMVTAVSKAELAMQSATAIRDRMVQAYQDIMHMPI